MAAGDSGSRARYRDALASRDYRLLTSSFLVDQIGSWAYSIVLIVYVFDRTHDTAWIAATTAASWSARLLAAYGGVLADRYERINVLVASALLSFVTMAGLTIVVGENGPLPLALALSFMTTAFTTVYRPAAAALIPQIVPEKALTAANALFNGLEMIGIVVGPAVGGLLLLGNDPSSAMALNALSFLASGLFVLRIGVRSRGGAGAEGESTVKQFTSGVRALVDERIAFVLVLFCLLDTAVYGASTVLYVPLSEHLGTGSEGYSYLIIGDAVGGVIFALFVVNRLSALPRLAPVILLGMWLLALPYALLVVVDIPAVAFVVLMVSGGGMIIVDVLAITALQRSVADAVMSRVFGLFESMVPVALLTGSFLSTVIYKNFGLRPALLSMGVGFSIAAVLGIGPVVSADRKTAAVAQALAPKVRLLQSLDMFAGASRNVVERLAAAVREVSIPAGQDVIREGEPADALWIIVSGEVDVSARGEGQRRHHLRTMGGGTYVGEIGLLHGLPRTATVRTNVPTMLWRIDAADFFNAVNESAVSGSMLSQSRNRLARSHPRLSTTTTTPEPSAVVG